MKKERLDIILCDKGLCDSRSKAQAIIMEGLVFVNDQRIDKPGTAVLPEARIEVRGNTWSLCQPRRVEVGKSSGFLWCKSGWICMQ